MAHNDRRDRGRSSESKHEQAMQSNRGRSGEMAWRDPFSQLWNDPFSLLQRDFWPFGRESSMWRSGQGRSSSGLWSPQIETFQRGDQFVIRADLPGLNKDDVTIELADDSVVIQGERREEHEEDREGYYRSERSYGSFYRVVPVPEGAITESAKASFNNGVLEISVQAPPREVSRRRRLEISGSAEENRDQKDRNRSETQRS